MATGWATTESVHKTEACIARKDRVPQTNKLSMIGATIRLRGTVLPSLQTKTWAPNTTIHVKTHLPAEVFSNTLPFVTSSCKNFAGRQRLRVECIADRFAFCIYSYHITYIRYTSQRFLNNQPMHFGQGAYICFVWSFCHYQP